MKRMDILAILIAIAPVGQAFVPAADSQTPSQSSDSKSTDWPGFLGPHRNGKSDERGLPASWPAKGPQLVWQKSVGAGYAAPAIVDGRVYHFSRVGDKARLICLDSQTGGQKWACDYPTDFVDMFNYANGPRATPLIDGRYVYTFGPEGILQCVRAADGHMIWRIDTTKQFNVVKNFFGVASSPIVWKDVLLVNIGGSPPGGPPDVYTANGNVESNGSAIVAFDKLTGIVRWKTGDDLASYSSPVLAKFAGRDFALMFARSGLLAIDSEKHETVASFPWRAKRLESVNASTPVIKGDEIFISETYEIGSAVVRFDGKAFNEVWTDKNRRRDRAMALHWNTPIELDGHLYGSSGYHTEEAELRCVEWKTGTVKWSQPTMGRSSLLLVDGTLVCLSEDGTLHLIKPTPERYTEIAKWELTDEKGKPLLPPPAWAAPALSRGLLYLEGDNKLVCLRMLRSK
jgi:outer membrane protein assembly factor BamB